MARNNDYFFFGSQLCNMFCVLLVIFIVCIVGVLLFCKFVVLLGYMSVFKEYQVNYVFFDFWMFIDEEWVLFVFFDLNNNCWGFDELVYEVNMSILQYVGCWMNFNDGDFSCLQDEYEKYYFYLREFYFNDFIQLWDIISQFYEIWYENEGGSVIEVLWEVVGKYICFFVIQVIIILVLVKG